MFYCYVLNSRKTGRRYVGSCEDLNARVDGHNAGKVKATRHGVPWIIVHNEAFSTRREAAGREHYYKTGRGRDELDAVVGRSPRRLTPTKRRVKMKLSLSILLVAVFGSAFFVRGQEAADADLQLREKSNATPRAAEIISPTAKVPELSEIDEVFKRTSLGKEADERRLHIEWRELSNRVVNDPDVAAFLAFPNQCARISQPFSPPRRLDRLPPDSTILAIQCAIAARPPLCLTRSA